MGGNGFFSVWHLNISSRPIVGAWKCEVTAMPKEAVLEGIRRHIVTRASAEADCVAFVLLHYIIGFPYFNSWLSLKQLTKNEENNCKYS